MKTFCLHNPPARDPGVSELQIALKSAKIYHGAIDGVFSSGTGDACKTAKYRLGYPSKDCTHCGGQTLLDYLTGKKHLSPAYTARRHARGYGLTKKDKQRLAIVKYAKWGIANEPQISYSQVRPMDHLNKVEALPWVSDCSEFVTTIYKWAGAPDPNGFGYNGQGWTGTLLDNGTSIPIFQAEPGDLVIWGPHPGHHVAVIIENSDRYNPILSSLGDNTGPKEIDFKTESLYQPRAVTVKRYI